MNNDNMKIVNFHEYCPTCEHRECKSTDEPCNECLESPVNYASHKPVKWEEKDNDD